MLIQTTAIVLKSFPYGDTSLIARCFTLEKGKMSFIIKGARSKKSGSAALFQPMSHIELIFNYKESRNLQIISKRSFIEIWPNIQNDLKRITLALSILEMTDKTLSDEDPHPGLFHVLVETYRAFNKGKNNLNVLFWFYELALLSHLGFQPDLDQRELPGLMLPDPSEGPKSRKILEMLIKEDLASIENLEVLPKDNRVISDYIQANLFYHFDTLNQLKSLNVLKKILS
ncbi:MAG: DNA repair protein RecO [Candidatus Marinimicrobia bacterium]|nr:DNA repair protein RecO [Candidatus Neomarinimicrobiota bacterium]